MSDGVKIFLCVFMAGVGLALAVWSFTPQGERALGAGVLRGARDLRDTRDERGAK